MVMSRKDGYKFIGGDIAGGTTAALVGIPEAIAYGTLVFAAFGDQFLAVGALAGLVTLFVANSLSAPLGSAPVMTSVPFSIAALLLAGFVPEIILMAPDFGEGSELGLIFFTVFLSACIQLLLSVFGFGQLVKYIPSPVMSGISNGTALLILAAQIQPITGLTNIYDLFNFSLWQWPMVFVGLVTIAVIIGTRTLTKRIPAPMVGLIVGASVYYSMTGTEHTDELGETVGWIPSAIPSPDFVADFINILMNPALTSFLIRAAPVALAIAVVVSLQTLVGVVANNQLAEGRADSKKELMAQSIANLATAMFGGLPTAGSRAGAIINASYGGRTSFSRVVYGLTALGVMLFLAPVVSKIPLVVLAGCLVVIGFRSVDPATFRLTYSLWKSETPNSNRLVDLCILVGVMVTVIAVGLLEAVFAGVLISCFLFVVRMGSSIIRRSYTAKVIRSHVQRPDSHNQHLAQNGDRIRIVELQGSLFFATADSVATTIEEAMDMGSEFILLDLKRCHHIDVSGAQMLAGLEEECLTHDISLALCGIDKTRGQHSELVEIVDSFRWTFDTEEHALAWAEDELILEEFGAAVDNCEMRLNKVDALSELVDDEVDELQGYLLRHEYSTGQTIMEQGAAADCMAFITRGRVEVALMLPDNDRLVLSELCAGTVIGEMGVFLGGNRSCTLIAKQPVVCYELSVSSLLQLSKTDQMLAYRLIRNLSAVLSARIRTLNRLTSELRY